MYFFNDYLSPQNCRNVFSFFSPIIFLFPNLGYIILLGGFKYYAKDFLFPPPIITYFLDMHIFRPLQI
jgi:hypothetical protein